MAIKVYLDRASGHVVFSPSDVDPKPTNSLHAYETDDGKIDVLSIHTSDRKEIARLDYTDVLTASGDPAGASLSETVNYLNGQFDASGVPGGSIPEITSPLTSSVVEGKPYLYLMSATYAPYLFLASGMPEGLSCNPSTGVISGVATSLGSHNVLLTAINAYGAASETMTLTVLASGGYQNTYSILFRDHVFYQHLTVNTSAAINHGTANPWSISAWVYLLSLRPSDIFSQGSSTNYRYIYLDANGRVVLSFLRSGGYRTHRTTTSLSEASWICLTVVYSAPGCTIYFNGVAQPVDLIMDTLVTEVNSVQDMRIGRSWGNLSDALWLDGYLDEWSYWNKSLSALEVLDVYNGGVSQNLTLLSFSGSLKQYLLMGDGDSYPTLTDNAAGNFHTANMVNMTALNIISFTP